MNVPQTEYVYETDRMVFFSVKYLTQEHMVSICEIMKEWSPNTSYERNRIVYNKQLKQLYDLEIHDKIACVYTYDTSIILQEEYVNEILDFLTVSIKKFCKTPMEANCCGFTLRVYKKNDKGYHTRSILGKHFPCQMEEIIYPFQFDSEFNRLKLRNISDIHTNPNNSNSSGIVFGNGNSTNLLGTDNSNNNSSGVMFGNSNMNNEGFRTDNSNSSGVMFGNSNTNNTMNNKGFGTSSGVMFGNSNTNNTMNNKGFGTDNSNSSGVMFGNSNTNNTMNNKGFGTSSGVMLGNNNSTGIFGPKSNNSGLFGVGQYSGLNNNTFGFKSQPSNMFNYKSKQEY
jgi:hypothetical protein